AGRAGMVCVLLSAQKLSTDSDVQEQRNDCQEEISIHFPEATLLPAPPPCSSDFLMLSSITDSLTRPTTRCTTLPERSTYTESGSPCDGYRSFMRLLPRRIG